MAGQNDLAISRERIDKEQAEVPTYYPSPEQKKLVATVKRGYADKDVNKRAYEKTWFINAAFMRGLHYTVYNDYTRTFEQPYKVPAHRVRLVVNLILSYWRRTKAKLTANRPGYFVRPASTEQSDVERSRLDEMVLESELDRMDFQILFKRWVGEMLQCGSALFFVGWDPFAGEPLFQQEPVNDWTGEAQMDPETGQPSMQQVPMTDQAGRHLCTGENILEVVSPLEFDADPQSTGLEDARWVRRDKVRSRQWIMENYPEKGKYVKTEAVYTTEFYQKRIRQMVGVFGYTTEAEQGDSDQGAPRDSAIVHEYWERKSKKYPKGRHVVVAGDVDLYDGANPYNHRKFYPFPFVKADEITIPDRFWGMSIIEQLIPLQKNYNRARSQEIENRTLVGRPKILNPRTAKIRQTSFDGEAGEKIDYNPGPRGEKPEIFCPAPISQATMSEIAHTLSDFQEVSASHEVSKGILPSANIPAEGIEMLQKTDETSMGDTVSNIDNALVQLGKMLLSNCAQFWDEERMVRATGEGNRTEAHKVTGQDLTGTNESADYFDVRITPASTLVKDPEKQREMVANLIQLGYLNPVADKDKIAKMLELGNVQDLFQDLRLDEQWAQRENELMEMGDYVVPRDFEDHITHVKIHNRFRKTERYRRLPQGVQVLYDQHVEQHQMQALQNAQKQAQMSLAIQAVATQGPAGDGSEEQGGGGPGGKPKPAPASEGA